MSFGTKFRLNRNINKYTAISIFKKDMNRFISSLCYKYNTPYEAFLEWESLICKQFTIFVNQKLNKKTYTYHNLDKNDLNFIKKLQNDFIIVPVDKAASNYAIICKKFYADKLSEELNNIKYYKKVELNSNTIIKKFNAYIKKAKSLYSYHFSISNYHSFPFLFMTPKFHKTPVKFRFICCNSIGIGKSFNVKLQNFLKKIYGFLKFKYKNSSYFWCLDNSFELLSCLNDSCNSFYTYDFENLFSNIPIDLLYTTLKNIFDEFHIEDELCINREFFLSLCHFCLTNNFIKLNNNIYNQKCGVGMGTNFSSTAANLFLFWFEYKFVIRTNKSLKIRRYVDDVIAINIDIKKYVNLIYPDCLNLKIAYDTCKRVNFLDLDLYIINNSLSINLYDKRNYFNFHTQTMPHWFSNLSKKVFINIIQGQTRRFYKICNKKEFIDEQIFKFTANLFYNNFYPYSFIFHYAK